MTKFVPSTRQPVKTHRAKQRTDWDEKQGVCESPVILQEQERISGRTDQDIEIGCHAGKPTHHGGCTYVGGSTYDL